MIKLKQYTYFEIIFRFINDVLPGKHFETPEKEEIEVTDGIKFLYIFSFNL
jgi:hypothetical protein